MVNLIETLLVLAAVAFVAALIMFLMGRRPRAGQLALAGTALGLVAGVLELYLRFVR